jgi:small subunit ribosomal protein S19|tara:strand:- start:1212 stop:1457 length:246 start_codon:yes stop_codon:yes gene_type:complete
MSRSIKKGYSSSWSLLQNNNNKTIKKVWSKHLVLLPSFIGLKFKLYTGNRFITVTINEDMVGHRIGEFISTRKKHVYKKGK